jgi:hypothetical protein
MGWLTVLLLSSRLSLSSYVSSSYPSSYVADIQAGLLAQLGPALGLVLSGVDLVLAGVLLLVQQILGALGINLNPILGSRKFFPLFFSGFS